MAQPLGSLDAGPWRRIQRAAAASAAVTALEAPAGMAAQKPVTLGLPQALHDAGIDAAWLVRANGAPTNAQPTAATTTFSDLWLVLHGQDISKD